MWAFKPLLLPSNGFFYKSIIGIKEPDLFLANRIQNEFIDSSESEFLYFIISRYTSFKEPEDMLYKDAFFIWMYLFSLINNGEPISVESTCKSCETKNRITIKLEDNNVTYLNSQHPSILKHIEGEFCFYYDYRKLKHNIESGVLELNSRDKENIIETIYSYIYPQCSYIENNNTKEKIDKNYLMEVLNSIGYKKTLNFFNEIKKEKWGLEDTYIYKCPKCNSSNTASFGDSFLSSIYSIDNNKTESRIKDLVYVLAYKTLTLEDILSIPLSQWEPISKTMIKIQKEKSGVKNFLDEISGE